MALSGVVQRRRRVRHFSPDPIDRDVLERTAARWEAWYGGRIGL